MRAFVVAVSILIISGCHAQPTPPSRFAVAPVEPVASPPPPAVAAATLDGYWLGALGGQLHLALSIKGSDAVLDSIDQGAKLPIENLSLKSGAVHFEIGRVHGSYEGKLDGERIEGARGRRTGRRSRWRLARGTAPAQDEQAKAPPPALLDAPIDVVVPKLPTPFRAEGRTHLVYELHLTNFSHAPVELTRVDVLAGVRSLATFDRAALGGMIPHTGPTTSTIAAGQHVVVYMWVSFDGAAPAKIDHRIAVTMGTDERTIAAPTIAIANVPPRVIAAPLKGAGWLAANGPSNTSAHRRALIPIGGHARIAQRFAIDWIKLGNDGQTFTGDSTKNTSYHAYGEHALAVAAGTVVEIKDGVIENVPHKPMAVPLTIDTVAGNHVVIDLGNGAFGMWAHLQPGSLKVKVGDRVKVGQELGLVGNSGNSTEPHLHFQVTDAASPLASEGVPYAFPKFSSVHGDEAPQDRKNELPTESALVSLP